MSSVDLPVYLERHPEWPYPTGYAPYRYRIRVGGRMLGYFPDLDSAQLVMRLLREHAERQRVEPAPAQLPPGKTVEASE